MGNLTSTYLFSDSSSFPSSPEQEQEIQDLKDLGNSFPFGDNEIRLFFRVYNQLVKLNLERRKQTHLHVSDGLSTEIPSHSQQPSFLQDLALYCYKFTVQQQHQLQQQQQQLKQKRNQGKDIATNTYHQWASEEEEEIFHTENVRRVLERRRQWIEIVEREILPPNFGNRLYEAVFFSCSNGSDNPPVIFDEKRKRWKLYHSYERPAEDILDKDDNSSITTTTAASTTMNSVTVTNDNNKSSTDNRSQASTNDYFQDDLTVDDEHISVRLQPDSNDVDVDPVNRKLFLESFFCGLAISSRRGSRAATKALFETCHQYESKLATPVSSSTSTVEHINIGTVKRYRVRAAELVNMGYRLALASSYLQDTGISNDQEQLNDTNKISGKSVSSMSLSTDSQLSDSVRNRYIPSPVSERLSLSLLESSLDPTLNAFCHSLVECARSRYQRSGLPGCFSSPHPDLDVHDRNSATVELDDVYEWLENVAPLFGSILPEFIQCFTHPPVVADMAAAGELLITDGTSNQVSFISSSSGTGRTTFCFPSVPDGSSDFFRSANSPLLFTFGCLSTSLSSSTPYHRLYASTTDGLSFNRLLNAIVGYSGPTLFIIRASSTTSQSNSTGNNLDGSQNQKRKIESVFGAFTASPWKEGKDFYGNTDCFLYQLSPCTAVYRPSGNAKNYMYCNSSARSKGYDQQAHGIGFGGTVQQPRLFLEESFENCTASSRDLTYENGHLLPQSLSSSQSDPYSSISGGVHGSQPQTSSYHFDIDSLEVWGVGTIDSINAGLQSRSKHRDVANEAIRRARKVDKAQFLDDLRSGVIDNKAFQHRAQIDGRADQDVDDRFNAAKQNF